jgi:hypothetical protein
MKDKLKKIENLIAVACCTFDGDERSMYLKLV